MSMINKEPYITPEMIKAWNGGGTYSTAETDTGQKWIDGKTIYRRVLDMGYLVNNDIKYYNLSDLAGQGVKFLRMYGIMNNASYSLPIPMVNSSGKIITLYAAYTGTNSPYIGIECADDRSSYYAYVVVEYTKGNS